MAEEVAASHRPDEAVVPEVHQRHDVAEAEKRHVGLHGIGAEVTWSLRVIYYWWEAGRQFWLFTLYDKDEMSDLTPGQRKTLKAMLHAEQPLAVEDPAKRRWRA